MRDGWYVLMTWNINSMGLLSFSKQKRLPLGSVTVPSKVQTVVPFVQNLVLPKERVFSQNHDLPIHL